MPEEKKQKGYRTPENEVQKIFRISRENADLLKQIAKANRRSEKATVEILIEDEAKRLGIKPRTP